MRIHPLDLTIVIAYLLGVTALGMGFRRLEQELLVERRKAVITLRNETAIDDEALRMIERELDFEELRLLRDDAEGA